MKSVLLVLCWLLLLSLALTNKATAGDKGACAATVSQQFSGESLNSKALADTYQLILGQSEPEKDELAGWAAKNLEKLKPGPSANDLVLFVHGFRTSLKAARCHGDILAEGLSRLPRYKDTGNEPNLLILAWPSDLPAGEFSRAQKIATKASEPLSALLSLALDSDRFDSIIVVAHSLGAQVAMDALTYLKSSGVEEDAISAVVLVQGAILGVSVRSWDGEMEIRHPSAEIHCLYRDDFDCRPPITFEYASGQGSYFFSSQLAEKLVVTISELDTTLRRFFSFDELHRPSDIMRPETTIIPGQLLPRLDVQTLAIGNPFPFKRAYNFFQPVLVPSIPDDNDFDDPLQPRLSPPDPIEVLEQTTITYTFMMEHPGYHEIQLERLPIPEDWHSPLYSKATREALLNQVWNLVFQDD